MGQFGSVSTIISTGRLGSHKLYLAYTISSTHQLSARFRRRFNVSGQSKNGSGLAQWL